MTLFTLNGLTELSPVTNESSSTGSVAQVSLEAARKSAQEQALISKIQQTQSVYKEQMEELHKFE